MKLSQEDLCSIHEQQDFRHIQRLGGVSSIAKILGSDSNLGIMEISSIPRRIQEYGSNHIPDIKISSFYEMLVDALKDDTLVILIVCAFLSLFLEMFFAAPEERSTAWIDGAAILFAVAIVSLVQASSNYKQEQQFAAVNRIKSIFKVAVVRNGRISMIKNLDLVVGDVVLLEQGNKIPADGLCLESFGIKVDQSTATGESEAVSKNISSDPFLISNTHVTEGRGRMIVTCVGLKSHHGKIFELIANEERSDTPLQEKLSALARKIGYIGIGVASVTYLILLMGWVINSFKNGWSWSSLQEPLDDFIIAITIVACAVPEGLPLAVTISLAYSMRQMMSDNNFVRHLSACETMGSATVICSDKTGTLTKNEMNVERLIVGLESNFHLRPDDPITNKLYHSIAVNTHAVISDTDQVGSQTECALVRFIGSDICKIHRHSANISSCFQFDRIRKRMSTIEIVHNTNSQNDVIVHVKGATDEVLPLCTHYTLQNGDIQPLTKTKCDKISTLNDSECSEGYRTLAIAYKIVKDENLVSTIEEAECNLILLAILSIRDSLRSSTASSVTSCQRAGIRVIMVTGDHMLTASSIAKECHIMKSNGIAITGQQLRSMSDIELTDILKDLCVIARATPADKHLIVSTLQQHGEIVAVTGDGTNDVAALIKADVGLAMGKCGTELAKEASDIVILDDDFRSIVKSVAWGRCVYNNIQRFLQFQLTANVSTLFISLVSAIILKDTPFQAVQLLWINLIMDSFGALSLATGKPHESLLAQKPHDKNVSLITSFMITNIVGQSIFQVIVVCIILLFPNKFVPYSMRHYTFLFNVFVLCQMWNLLNARATCETENIYTGLLDTPLFLSIMCCIGIVQFILVNIAGKVFSCTPLNIHEWILSLSVSFLSIPLGFILRKIAPKISSLLFHKSKREDNQPLLISKI